MMELLKEKPLRTVLAIVALVGAISGGIFLLEDRYASAQTVKEINEQNKSVNTKISKMVKITEMQYRTQKTILDMKRLSPDQELTPEEEVQLETANKILEMLEDDSAVFNDNENNNG